MLLLFDWLQHSGLRDRDLANIWTCKHHHQVILSRIFLNFEQNISKIVLFEFIEESEDLYDLLLL